MAFMESETVEDRINHLKRETQAVFDTSEVDELTSYAQGILAGIQQAALWLTEPSDWAEPIGCVPGLRNVYDQCPTLLG